MSMRIVDDGLTDEQRIAEMFNEKPKQDFSKLLELNKEILVELKAINRVLRAIYNDDYEDAPYHW